MKITISKSQWEKMGKTAGWMDFKAEEFLTILEQDKGIVLEEIFKDNPDIVRKLMSKPEFRKEYLKMTGKDYVDPKPSNPRGILNNEEMEKQRLGDLYGKTPEDIVGMANT